MIEFSIVMRSRAEAQPLAIWSVADCKPEVGIAHHIVRLHWIAAVVDLDLGHGHGVRAVFEHVDVNSDVVLLAVVAKVLLDDDINNVFDFRIGFDFSCWERRTDAPHKLLAVGHSSSKVGEDFGRFGNRNRVQVTVELRFVALDVNVTACSVDPPRDTLVGKDGSKWPLSSDFALDVEMWGEAKSALVVNGPQEVGGGTVDGT